MANISKQITLSAKQNSAGPLFDAYYSTDCVNFTICIDGTNISLPSVGSTAIVTVPDTTACIKLINKTAICNNNEYVSGSVPTTTTTTTAGPALKQFIFSSTGTGNEVQFLNKFNQTKTITFNNVNTNAVVCAYDNSIIVTSGSVSQAIVQSTCPDNNYVRIYTTNSANSKGYTYESSSGEIVQFAAGQPSSFDTSVCIVSGSYVKQTSSTYQLFDNLGACPTTTTTTTTSAGSASLDWSYTTFNAVNGNMQIYVNDIEIANHTYDATGNWTVYVGDTIKVSVSGSGCTGGNNYANVYTTGIISDAACAVGSTSMTTAPYTVLTSDIGTTLSLDIYARCDSGCV